MHSCFLTVYVQHILTSERWFLLHLGKGESEKLAVKQYESYNRGLALSDPSWLLIGWRTWSHPSHWLGPGCSLLLLQGLPASRTKVRNVATWDPPGLVSLRSFQISRETCLPVGWRHHHTFKWMPRTAFCWLVGFRKRVFNLNIWNIHRCLNVKRKQPAWPEKMFNNNFAKFPTASCDCCQSTLVRRSLATQKWNCNLLACL